MNDRGERSDTGDILNKTIAADCSYQTLLHTKYKLFKKELVLSADIFLKDTPCNSLNTFL